MDPEACLDRFLNAWRDQDVEEAEEAAHDYNVWIWGGGFAATLPDEGEVIALNAHTGEVAIRNGRATTAENLLRDR